MQSKRCGPKARMELVTGDSGLERFTKALREVRGGFPRTLLASRGRKGEWGHPR